MGINATKFPRLSGSRKDEDVSHPPLERGRPSVEKVLFSEWSLCIIFDYCASGGDLKTLLNLRQVCYFWWDASRRTLRKNSSLLPTIGHKLRSTPGQVQTHDSFHEDLAKFRTHVTPAWELPVNIVICTSQWTRDVNQFFTDYSENITSWSVSVVPRMPLPRYALQQDFRFPALKQTTLKVVSDSHNFGMLHELSFWRTTISHSRRIETCELDFKFILNPFVLMLNNPLNPARYQVPNELTTLSCPDIIFFNRISRTGQQWPRLLALSLGLREGENISEDFQERGRTLKSLTLSPIIIPEENDDDIFTLQVGEMNNLEKLELIGNTGVTGENRRSLQVLLPNLREVTGNSARLFELTENNAIFEGVSKLSIADDIEDDLFQPDADEYIRRMERFVVAFANLKILHWSVMGRVENITGATGLVFSNLGHLTELKIDFHSAWLVGGEIVELLTGLHEGEIPRDHTTWKDALEGRNTVIRNLQNLEKFELIVHTRYNIISRRDIQFLHTAAFSQIPKLGKNVRLDGFLIDWTGVIANGGALLRVIMELLELVNDVI